LPSSALKNTDRNSSKLSILGRPWPTDPQAAIAAATQLFPCPGSPSRSVSFPTGRYGRQRKLTACGCTSDIRIDLKAGRPAAAVLSTQDGAAAARESSSRATTASALPSRRRSSIQSEASPFAGGPCSSRMRTSPVTPFQRLEAQGIEVRANIAANARVSGISFAYDGVACKGSDLGRGYSWRQLQERAGISYEPVRDLSVLRAAGERATASYASSWPPRPAPMHPRADALARTVEASERRAGAVLGFVEELTGANSQCEPSMRKP
jgi:hypothetical protein